MNVLYEMKNETKILIKAIEKKNGTKITPNTFCTSYQNYSEST